MQPVQIFENLLNKYGHQGWWPIFIENNDKIELKYGIGFDNLEKYKTENRDPYFEIALGALLTQNTTWNNASKALYNLFKNKLLTPQMILKTEVGILENLIRSAGYYRQKAKKIILFCEWLTLNYNGNLLNFAQEELIKARQELLSIWGIGKETADSILLYALNKPIFVVDSYTKRFLKEQDIMFAEYDDYRLFIENAFKEVGDKEKIYNELHALFVESQKNRG